MKNQAAMCFILFSAIMLHEVGMCISLEVAPANEEIELRIVDKGHMSGYNVKSYLVIRDEMAWTAVWERHIRFSLQPRPIIDFSESMVLCAFMGEYTTTGHSVSIERVYVEDEKLHVLVVEHHPPPTVFVGQAFTYPYVIVSLERLDLEVDFESRLVEYPYSDVNFDKMVDIFDVFIVAKAFGSKPGETGWNPYADLNKSDPTIIDIFDVVTISKTFGTAIPLG